MKRFLWLSAMLLLAGGCATHPLGIDDRTWQSMSHAQRMEATAKQGEIVAAARAEQAHKETERRRRQEEEDARLLAFYQARSQGAALLPGMPYGVVPAGAGSVIHVMVSGQVRFPHVQKEVPYTLAMAPLTLAPCEVKQVKFAMKSGNQSVLMPVWVAYVPPAFYWDLTPDPARADLERYASCDAGTWATGTATVVRAVPGSAAPFTHRSSAYVITGATAEFSVP